MELSQFSLKTSKIKLISGLMIALALPILASSPAQSQSHSHTHSHEKPPTTSQASSPTKNKALEQKSLDILNWAKAGEYNRILGQASPELSQKLTSSDIERIWEEFIKKAGSVEKVDKVHTVNTVNADLVILNTCFTEGKGSFIMTYNLQGQLVGVDFPAIGTIEQIAKAAVTALAEDDFVRARGYLSPFLKAEIFPQDVQAKWKQLLRSTGDFKQIESLTVRPGSAVDSTDVVLVTVQFANTTDNIFVIFDENRRIVGLDVPEANR